MTQYSVAELAERVGGQLFGDHTIQIHGPADISTARTGEISFVANSKYYAFLETTKASAVVLENDTKCSRNDLTLIRVANPNLAFTQIIQAFAKEPLTLADEISPKAQVAKSAKLGKGARVAAFSVISENVEIGEGTQIHSGVFIGPDAKVGKNGIIYPNVCIREGVQVGDRAVIHSGTVIGSDGFGFDLVQGRWVKVPQCGTVIVEDDVEFGANCTIDRARFGATRIGRGVKFDNQVHVAHNVEIGHDSLLIAQVGIAGSSTLGHHVIIAGQTGVSGHVTIGDGAKIAGQAGVGSDVPPGAAMGGVPAFEFSEWVRVQGRVRKIGEYATKISQLSRRVEELEKKLGGSK